MSSAEPDKSDPSSLPWPALASSCGVQHVLNMVFSPAAEMRSNSQPPAWQNACTTAAQQVHNPSYTIMQLQLQ